MQFLYRVFLFLFLFFLWGGGGGGGGGGDGYEEIRNIVSKVGYLQKKIEKQ